MTFHAKKASCYQGRQFLRLHGFKTSSNEISLRKTVNYFMVIYASKQNWSLEMTGIRRGQVYPVAKNGKVNTDDNLATTKTKEQTTAETSQCYPPQSDAKTSSSWCARLKQPETKLVTKRT